MKKANSLISGCTVTLMILAAGSALAGTTTADMVKFDDKKVKASLTGQPGNAADGKKWFASRKLGNCLACHTNKDMVNKPFHGEIGPPIDGVAGRYSKEELRAILVNSKMALSEETLMPGFYSLKTGARTAKKFKGKTILNGQQVEDIIAYLLTLKE